MANSTSEEKSDGLEIISIGKLYSGTWEKKYWSSSRGKDRFPYPFGFKAVRTQNGITYRMEIFEGLKGPLFTISSTDGLSCSGQTPDIAWESFQKKGCSQLRLWRGKSFSCKIDGMELFGFKNAFVQRLLRELVANVGGNAEQNLLPSGSCNESSETGYQIQQNVSVTYPDLVSYFAKPRVVRKRSRKENMINVISKSRLKNVRCRNEKHKADASNTRQRCRGKDNKCHPSIFRASNEDNEVCKNAGALLKSENLERVIEEETVLVSTESGLPLNSFDVSGNLKVDLICAQEESKRTGFGSYIALQEDGDLPKGKEPFDRSKVSTAYQLNGSVTADEDGERIDQSKMETINSVELCVPDTLDHPPEPTEDISNSIDNAAATKMTVSEVLETESHPDDEVGTSNSNPSSENADFDSVGQDIAKSMMTVLLPRAVPLLKTFSRKKMNKAKPSESSTNTSLDNKTDNLASPVTELKENLYVNEKKQKAQISTKIHECSDYLESVVPDSVDNDENANPLNNKLPLFPEAPVDNQSPVVPETCRNESALNAEAGSSGFEVESADGKTSTIHKEELVLNLEPHELSDRMSKSSLDFSFPSEKETFTKSAKNSSVVGNHSVQESANTLPNSIEDILDPPNSCQEKSDAHCVKELLQDNELADFDMPASSLQIQRTSHSSHISQKEDVKDGSSLINHTASKQNDELHDGLKLVACYTHPLPILLVLLSTVGNKIYLCLLCGSLEQEDKILFVYNAPISGEKTGCPSFIGHASVIFPHSQDALGRNIALDGSGIQFTPDAQSLVLLNSIKIPCCREGSIHCPCLLCTSDCVEENAVKVVHLKAGFASLVTKLKTDQTVHCILVCEPNYLVAADESGKLYLWVMNSRWSAQIEECYLTVPDNIPSCQVELKKLPNSATLVVGHNGFGTFSLWDIGKRILVSKFSAPSTSVSKFVPISLLQWKRKGDIPTDCYPELLIDEILDATKIWFSGSREKQLAPPIDSKDVAVWLLISAISHPDGYQSGGWQIDSGECWRLALLVRDMVIMGSALDPRAAAISASVGQGIIGRCDGLVYMWELSTGIKVGNLHQFIGTGVSCIASDHSNSGALAIASDNGQLLVYMHS